MASAYSGSEVLYQITLRTHISRNCSGLLEIFLNLWEMKKLPARCCEMTGRGTDEQGPICEVMGFGQCWSEGKSGICFSPLRETQVSKQTCGRETKRSFLSLRFGLKTEHFSDVGEPSYFGLENQG